MNEDKKQHDITPEVGKRYVTRGGWITPPLEVNDDHYFPFRTGIRSFTKNGAYFTDAESDLDLIAEYVEPTVPDTYRRDLEAQLYVETTSILLARDNIKFVPKDVAKKCIIAAAALIEAQEEAK